MRSAAKRKAVKKRKPPKAPAQPKEALEEVARLVQRIKRLLPPEAGKRLELAIRQHGTRVGTTAKFNISIEKSLADDIREAAAKESEGNVSAWLAKVAEEGLRRLELKAVVEEDAARFGPVTEDEREAIRREWPRD
jgi:hypothetical protein